MAEPGAPSPKILYPWQHDYQAALLELDPEKLPQRVEAAETAIFKRLQTISQGSDSNAERQAIEDALASLRVLSRRNWGFPTGRRSNRLRGYVLDQRAGFFDRYETCSDLETNAEIPAERPKIETQDC
jgi:hypothetical protein